MQHVSMRQSATQWELIQFKSNQLKINHPLSSITMCMLFSIASSIQGCSLQQPIHSTSMTINFQKWFVARHWYMELQSKVFLTSLTIYAQCGALCLTTLATTHKAHSFVQIFESVICKDSSYMPMQVLVHLFIWCT